MEYAVDQRVDVVALSGDVVDQANKFYEALGPLERGLLRLREAGIVTVAVAGNHDYDVLPQVARAVHDDSFRLLGVGGVWQRTTITSRSGELLHVDGWSFPAEHVSDDPLASYDLRSESDAPVLGLLHANLDVPGSRYAPVSLASLRARQISLWLLGHIHGPMLHDAPHGTPVLYPGSPQPMDPGEPGAHGAWLVEARSLETVEPRFVPMASVRYDSVSVDVTGAADEAALRLSVVQGMRARVTEFELESGGALRHLSLRLRLVGRTELHRQVAAEARAISANFDVGKSGVALHIEDVIQATSPARDVTALARGTDAAALLALLARSAAGADSRVTCDEVLEKVRSAAEGLCASRQYLAVANERETLDDANLRAAIELQSLAFLDEILAQKEPT